LIGLEIISRGFPSGSGWPAYLVTELDELENGLVTLLAALSRYYGHLGISQHLRGRSLVLHSPPTGHKGIHPHKVLLQKLGGLRQANG